MQVDFQYAEEHFAELVKVVDDGEVVEITRPNKPTLLLILADTPASQA